MYENKHGFVPKQEFTISGFLEKYPNAPMDKDGLPLLSPRKLGYCGDKFCYAREKAKDKPLAWCWNQEAESNETD